MKRSDIEHIANLAMLELTENELDALVKEFEPILTHFDQLKELNTDGVDAFAIPSEIEYWLREDDVLREMTVDEAVGNAPERAGHLFKVPPVV